MGHHEAAEAEQVVQARHITIGALEVLRGGADDGYREVGAAVLVARDVDDVSKEEA